MTVYVISSRKSISSTYNRNDGRGRRVFRGTFSSDFSSRHFELPTTPSDCYWGSKSTIKPRARGKMAAAEGLAAPQEEIEMAGECEDSKDETDEKESFAEVRRKRKRKLKSLEMEVEGEELKTAAKRPSFPPVNASSALVGYIEHCS